MRTFRSDNNTALCPEALAAINAIAEGGSHVVGYGDDSDTAEAESAFRSIFGESTAAFLVATGTAANGLAIASLTRPWQKVLCHVSSHWWNDELTAPELLTGCRSVAIGTVGCKLTPDDVHAASMGGRHDVHEPGAGVLTITNPTENGLVYSPDEVAALVACAREYGYRVHMDGARFANAVARLGCDPRALTVDVGVDALSFGGTKNGLALGEAVVFFPREEGDAASRAAEEFPFRRKASGHLLSKHRFVSAPFAATLRDGAWLRHAAHANAMATRLGDGLAKLGMRPAFEVEANAVFVSLPPHVDASLREAGHGYYAVGPPALGLVRLMASFDTTTDDVDGFLADARRAMSNTR